MIFCWDFFFIWIAHLHDDHICKKSHRITQKHQRISLWFEKLHINWVLPATFCWSCWFVTDVRPFSRSFRDTQLRFHPKCRRIGIAHVNRLSSFIFLENLSRFQRHKTSIDVIVSMNSKKWIGDIRCSRIETGSNPLGIKLLWFGYWETGLQMIHSLGLQLLHFFNLLGFLFFDFYDIIQNLLCFFCTITFNDSQKNQDNLLIIAKVGRPNLSKPSLLEARETHGMASTMILNTTPLIHII